MSSPPLRPQQMTLLSNGSQTCSVLRQAKVEIEAASLGACVAFLRRLAARIFHRHYGGLLLLQTPLGNIQHAERVSSSAQFEGCSSLHSLLL